MTRRKFIALTGGLASVLTGCHSLPRLGAELVGLAEPDDDSPIQRDLESIAPRQFSGDFDPTAVHERLWSPPRLEFASSRETNPVVIIGGGVSGLASAYLLRRFRPILLEQASRFGGNAKAQSWRGIDYPIGAAYFNVPDPGTALHQLLVNELKADEYFYREEGADSVSLDGKWMPRYWKSANLSDGPLSQLRKLISQFNEGDTEVFPDMSPGTNARALKSVADLDHDTFLSYVTRRLGELPPDLQAVLEGFAWSTLGGEMAELSAAAAMNFLAAEFLPRFVSPAGNARVADLLLKKIRTDDIRSRSLVVKVEPGPRPLVSYLDEQNKAHQIECDAVVFACPKFIVKRILTNVDETRKAAWDNLTYRSYLVANVCLDTSARHEFYDLYLARTKDRNHSEQSTDVLWGNVREHKKGASVLTFYRPLPEGSRTALLEKSAYESFRLSFEREIYQVVLPLIGIEPRFVRDVRVARWGHAIPLAKVGSFSPERIAKVRDPIGGNIFFVNQDNWSLPCLETCLNEAIYYAEQIGKKIA